MLSHLDDQTYTINQAQLAAELLEDNCALQAISATGELVIDDLSLGDHHADRREVWQAMPVGAGANNTYWGDLPGGYEFCRSIKLSD